MKKLRGLLVLVITLMTMISASVFVNADTTTDLSTMKVYAVDASGNKSEVPMEFDSTTYEYDLTVLSTTVSISVEASTVDSASTWKVEKEGINTKMDTGKNYTEVSVTSASGAVQVYKLNTTKLTAAEEATYEAPSVDSNPDNVVTDNLVTVGKKQMGIVSSFDKKLIPEGFEKATAEYNGNEYTCIKGEVKSLTAFYLRGEDAEGFYIYDADNNEFYAMNNIKIKSRMYTIVNPEKTESILKNYKKQDVTIIDQEVKAWVLDADEGMYLVYAMNWNGETNLYCYDDNEKCFQKYLLSSNEAAQIEAAKKAYENIQDKYNNLVDKYNILMKIACGLVIVIIILIFVIINLAINKKEKKVKKAKRKAAEEGLDSFEMDEDDLSMINDEVDSMMNDESVNGEIEDFNEDSMLIDLFVDSEEEAEESDKEDIDELDQEEIEKNDAELNDSDMEVAEEINVEDDFSDVNEEIEVESNEVQNEEVSETAEGKPEEKPEEIGEIDDFDEDIEFISVED